MIFPLRSSVFATPGAVAGLLIVLMLAVQSGGVWYGLEIVKLSKEEELRRHLEDLGRVFEPEAREAAYRMADAAYEAARAVALERGEDAPSASPPDALTAARERDYYLAAVWPEDLAPFDRLAESARLRGVALLDETGRVLHDTREPGREMEAFAPLALDADRFATALRGRPAASIAYTAGDAPLKRVYIPVRDPESGIVAAVLCLAAGRDYLGDLDRLAAHLRLVSSASSILVVLVGWLVYRILLRQKRMESRAAHADRLGSLGAIAAGFAHEVRNPLGIIGACAEDLRESLARMRGAPPDALESCADISGEVERLNRLVSQFLQYSRSDSAGVEAGDPSGVCDARAAVASAAGLLRRDAERKGVRLEAPDPPASPADALPAKIAEGALRQIVVNLTMNALQATAPGGGVRVSIAGEGRRVRVRVEDDGPGVPPAHRRKIFDPFFTTREQGSGLGLAIAHRLAERVGGSLELEPDAKGRGARFVLELPRAGTHGGSPSPASRPAATNPETPVPAGKD